jgi:GT2 family glycosyltransferase
VDLRPVVQREVDVTAPGERELVVVIVAYGPAESLDRCLESLGQGLRVIVVDNGCSDEARAVATGAGATYLDPGRNLGFASGVNLALSHLDPSAVDVLLVNPDAEVTPASIQALQRALRADPSLACVAPTLRDGDGEHPVRGGWPFPTPGRAWLDAFGLGRLVPQREFVIGAVLLLSGEALREVGTFDERFFLYSEETDWQRRATGLGWKIRQVEEASARHIGAGTGGDPLWREAAFLASVQRYISKWYGMWGWVSFRTGASLAAARRTFARDPRTRATARRRLKCLVRGPERTAARLNVPLLPVGSSADHTGGPPR